MNILTARFTVGRRVVAGLIVIVALGLIAMLTIYRGLNTVQNAVDRLSDVDEPLTAAAYEMEVNVNGIAFAVLKYLATGKPEYRERVVQDNTDFLSYHSTYDRLVGTLRERELATEIKALYLEFRDLGFILMGKRSEQEKRFVAVSEGIENIDRIIDQDMQPIAQPFHSSSVETFSKALVLAKMEAEIAEVGFWLTVYQRAHANQARDTVFVKMKDFEREQKQLLKLRLDNRERALVTVLQSIYGDIAGQIQTVVALEDEIKEKRGRFVGLRVRIDQLLDNEIQVLLSRGIDVPRQMADSATRQVLETMRYLLPLFVLTAGLVGYLLLRSLLAPLRGLKKGTQAVGSGDLDYRIAQLPNDEFGDLAGAFNQMVAQLRDTTVARHLLASSEEKLQQTVSDLRHQMSERERADHERERLQAKLRRTETMSAMGALVAGVAHEVRNPLFGISSTLDAMDARLGERPEYGRYRDVLRGEVNRLGKLMSDLLNYAKPAVELMEPFQVEDVVAEAVKVSQAVAEQREVIIDNRVGEKTTPVELAYNRLMQVFVNLIENAIQHSPPGSTVLVETGDAKAEGRHWVDCKIRDAGSGIREADLPKVFEPFFTRRRGGTGLGLSIAQRIVEEHGGQILARNHSDGGALMTVRIPIEST